MIYIMILLLDTSFMYMIAWLCMLKIYQSRHPDINANAHTAFFAIALVIFLAVLGVVSQPSLLSLPPLPTALHLSHAFALFLCCCQNFSSPSFYAVWMLCQVALSLVLTVQIYTMGQCALGMHPCCVVHVNTII